MEVVGPPELAEAFSVQAERFAAAGSSAEESGVEASGLDPSPSATPSTSPSSRCCSHEVGLPPDAESMAFWTEELRRSDTLLYGRVTYELMEGAWRRP